MKFAKEGNYNVYISTFVVGARAFEQLVTKIRKIC
jgi:hypothetical protein